MKKPYILEFSDYVKEIQTLDLHKGQVTAMAWSPNGEWFTSCSIDGVLNIFNSQENIQHRFSRPVFNSPLASLAWSRDGKYIVCGSTIGTLNIWEVGRFNSVEYKAKSKKKDTGCLTWGPSGVNGEQRIAFGGKDRNVHFYDFREWKCHAEETGVGHVEAILSIAWSPDGTTVVTGTEMGTIGIWKPFSIEDRNLPNLKEGTLNAWFADSGMHGTFAADGHILYRLSSVLSRESIYANDDEINSVAWSEDSNILASGGRLGYLCLWNVENEEILKDIDGKKKILNLGEEIFDVKFGYNGKILFVQTMNFLRIITTETLSEICTHKNDAWFDLNDPIIHSSLAVDSANNRLATISPKDKSKIIIYEVDYKALFAKISDKWCSYRAVAISLFGLPKSGRTSLSRALTGIGFEPKNIEDAFHVYTLSLNKDIHENGDEEKRDIFFWDLPSRSENELVHDIHAEIYTISLITLRPLPNTRATDPENLKLWVSILQHYSVVSQLKNSNFITIITHSDELLEKPSSTDTKFIADKLNLNSIYFVSNETNYGIPELIREIYKFIDWQKTIYFPFFDFLKNFQQVIIHLRDENRYLVSIPELYNEFLPKYPIIKKYIPSHSDEYFQNVLLLMKLKGEIYVFDSSDEILLEPLYYRVYVSAMMDGARKDEKGMGRLPINDARKGYGKQINFEKNTRIKGKQQLKLHGFIIKELQEKNIALEVSTNEGVYLVFPKTLSRERDNSEPRPPIVANYRIRGAVDDIYSSIIVRLLGLSVNYPKNELWKNEAIFIPADEKGSCGLKITPNKNKDEAELSIYFDIETNITEKLNFRKHVFKYIEDKELVDILSEQPLTYNNSKQYDAENVINNEVFLLWNREAKQQTEKNVKIIAELLKQRNIATIGDSALKPGQRSDEDLSKLDKCSVVLILLDGSTNEEQQKIIRQIDISNSTLIPIILPTAPENYNLPAKLKNLGIIDLRINLLDKDVIDSIEESIIDALKDKRNYNSFNTYNKHQIITINSHEEIDFRKSSSSLRIFISYSHAQRDYFPIFKADLIQYARIPGLDVEVFGDDAIPIGTAWDEFLQTKVADCDAMILLVSQEFMNSNYIQENEFGAALERLKAGRSLLIAPIYFAPCQFESDEELSRLQFFKPHGDGFGEAQNGNRFSYIDLVKFRQNDGQPIPNANRAHYMMELMRKLGPQLRELA